MANTMGQAYGLTMLSPIRGDIDATGHGHDIEVRRALHALNAEGAGPLPGIATLHLARWVVIDDMPYEGLPAVVDHLASKYLLFTACFDGDLEAFSRAMWNAAAPTITTLYRHCWGFSATDASGWRDYVRRCQVETTFFFGAYPEAPLERVLRALDLQRNLSPFIEQHQAASSPAELQRAFLAFAAERRTAPTPTPASI